MTPSALRGTNTLAWRAAAIGVSCVAVLLAVYVVAVRTPAGQRFEDEVLNAAAAATRSRQELVAMLILATVRKVSVVAAILVILAIAFRRRQAYTGIVAAAVVVAAGTTADVLDRVFSRPILLAHGYRRDDQSFPSGHTAIAMAVMAALVLVVPHRLRWYVVALTAPWAVGMGLATVTVGWHRPSDTVGGDLIALMYACVAIVLLARRGYAQPVRSRPGLAAVVGFVAGVGCLAVLIALGTSSSVFTSGRAIVLGASVAVTLALLALLHGTDFRARMPARDSVEKSPAGNAASL